MFKIFKEIKRLRAYKAEHEEKERRIREQENKKMTDEISARREAKGLHSGRACQHCTHCVQFVEFYPSAVAVVCDLDISCEKFERMPADGKP